MSLMRFAGTGLIRSRLRLCLFTGLVCTALASTAALPPVNQPPSLHESFASRFAIGFGTEVTSGARMDLVHRHASIVTCENSLKPGALRAEPDVWNWEKADAWLAWTESLGKTPIGHTLVWGYMQPKWLLERIAAGKMDATSVLRWQDDHIRTVLARYGERIRIWDVVNEALADGPDDAYLRNDPWANLCGEAYVIEAFRSARAAAPRAHLRYNDYNLEQPAKRARLLRLLKQLEAAGCRPDSVGIQGHWTLKGPPASEVEAAIIEINAAGYSVDFTEIDVSIYAWIAGANLQEPRNETATPPGYQTLPDELQAQLTERYREVFRVFVKHADKIGRVTFWNVDDGSTWLNVWPVRGRPNHPLLFDRQQQPKPAFWAVLGEAETCLPTTTR
ncbi:MAG: endo-1,4-beta-xylanase [Opitutaceae bacterium]|nr:endo-1,4-beta-xylanase [Opitutaceae bacterium]